MKVYYPILEKMPILLPFMWIVRIIQRVFSKEVLNKSIYKIKMIKNTNEKDMKEIEKIYQKIGIVIDKKYWIFCDFMLSLYIRVL